MDWNHILKRVVVGVIIAIIMMFVHKAAHAATEYYNPIGGTWGSSWQSAATAYCASYNPSWTYQYVDETATQVNVRCLENGVVATGILAISKRTVADTGPTCTAGKVVQYSYIEGGGATIPQVSLDGCVTGKPKLTNCFMDGSQKICNAESTETGEQATGQSDPKANEVATPGADATPVSTNVKGTDTGGCPAGTSNVGSDSSGTPMCVGSGTDPIVPADVTSTTPKTTTTNSDGSSNTTESKTTNNADGSATTATTNCAVAASGASSCSTSYTTTTTSSGTPGKKDSDTPTVCDENPQLNMCQNSQVTDGGCNGATAGIGISGDAIQGAILRRMANTDCSNSQNTSQVQLGNQMMSGTDPMAGSLPSASNPALVDLGGNGQLDQSGFLGGGSCMADKSFSVSGMSFSIPFSNVCPNLLPLRAGIMVVAFLIAYGTLSGAILRK